MIYRFFLLRYLMKEKRKVLQSITDTKIALVELKKVKEPTHSTYVNYYNTLHCLRGKVMILNKIIKDVKECHLVRKRKRPF